MRVFSLSEAQLMLLEIVDLFKAIKGNFSEPSVVISGDGVTGPVGGDLGDH